MKKLILITLLLSSQAKAGDYLNVQMLALKNGYNPDKRVIKAVVRAAHWYAIDPLDLAAIGLIETGLGKFNQDNVNKNGTVDKGIFQINTVNQIRCLEFNLNSPEGSAMCAAKLLQSIRRKYASNDPKWKAVYHSKTKEYKEKYFRKIAQVLDKDAE